MQKPQAIAAHIILKNEIMHTQVTNMAMEKKPLPFSAVALPPFFNFKSQGNREKIVMASRSKYAGKRKEIERNIEKQAC